MESTHFTEEQKVADSVRNDFLIGKGFSLLRFTNQEILANIEQVKYKIMEKMEELRSKTTAVGGGNQTTPPRRGLGRPFLFGVYFSFFVNFFPSCFPIYALLRSKRRPFAM